MPDSTSLSLTLAYPRSGRHIARPRARYALAVATTGIALAVAGTFAAVQTSRPELPLWTIAVPAQRPLPISEAPEVAALLNTSAATLEQPARTEQAPAPALDQRPETAKSAPIAETSSVRQIAGAPPAAVPAAPPLAPAPVHSGERWAADGITLVFEGQEWDADSLAGVDLALSKLPPGIRAHLGNRELGGMTILVNRFGRTLAGKQPYAGAANFFSTNDGRNELVLFPGQTAQTMLHEMGHAYNLRRIPAGRYALVLLDPEMQSFMAATGWKVLGTADEIRAARDHMGVRTAYEGTFTWPRISNNDPLEDFANSFALYFLNPEDLKARSAERFAWFAANVAP